MTRSQPKPNLVRPWLAILGAVLAVISIIVIRRGSESASKDATLVRHLDRVRTAVDAYRAAEGRYPARLADIHPDHFGGAEAEAALAAVRRDFEETMAPEGVMYSDAYTPLIKKMHQAETNEERRRLCGEMGLEDLVRYRTSPESGYELGYARMVGRTRYWSVAYYNAKQGSPPLIGDTNWIGGKFRLVDKAAPWAWYRGPGG